MLLKFPYIYGETKGIINYTVNQNQNDIPIELTSSTLDDTTTLREYVYYDTDKYFSSLTNCSENANFFTIEFVDSFIKAYGYIIKSDFTNDYNWYLRSWKLEGSLDYNKWEELHSQSDVDDLSKFEGGSYPISNHNIFKYFRVTQTGQSLGNTDHLRCRLRIRYIDFFGILSDHISFGTCTFFHHKSIIPIHYFSIFILIKI